MKSNLIVVRRLDGSITRVEPAQLYLNRQHYHLQNNARGELREARERPRMSLSPLCNDGRYFLQALDGGRPVRALRGTLGSKN
jgi:hypothetical protein